MPGFAGVTPTYKPATPVQTFKRAAPQQFGGGPQTGSHSLDIAVRGAKAFRDQLGLPSYQDILGKLGNGPGSKEFGNAGAAGEGAAFAKGEIGNWKNALKGERGQLDVLRGNIKNPTKTEGFRNVMRLTNERLGQAAQTDQRQAAEAATRRGYVGGYSPGQTEVNRMDALASAGYEAADRERQAQQAQFGNEAGLYGSQLGGYNAALGAYTDLTKTQAELPTKWLDSYAGLLSGLGGGYGDIFGTALKGAMYDEDNRRSILGENRRRVSDAVGFERSRHGGTGVG